MSKTIFYFISNRTYKPPISISNDGKYFISRFKSSNSRSFPHSKRTIETVGMLSSPGPGKPWTFIKLIFFTKTLINKT